MSEAILALGTMPITFLAAHAPRSKRPEDSSQRRGKFEPKVSAAQRRTPYVPMDANASAGIAASSSIGPAGRELGYSPG
eukprot:3497521-Pyramimonas_sp.AAC.1